MIQNMLEYLENSATRTPERIAFYDDRESLTYGQLRDKARRIGTRLAAATCPRRPIALLLDARSIRNIPALYGALYAGCAYAPLDITMPPERLTLLLELMAPGAILADEKGEEAVRDCRLAEVPFFLYQEAVETAEDDQVLARIREQATPDDPMSILYTSGSTGIPKGSVSTQSNYLHWTPATIKMYTLTEDTVFGNQSPFFYANSVLDIFPPVALGAKVYLMPAGALTFPRKFVGCLQNEHVNLLCMTPSSFISVVNAGALEPSCVPELKWGIMSGESMPWPPLDVWMQASPNASWWHFYGSTEMFSVAVGVVNPSYAQEPRLPVGKIFPQVEVLFLDEDGEPVPAGEPGEMFVNSPWVGAGYHRDPDRTAQSWVELGGKTYYRSGDLGYLRTDEQLMVLGRRDNQIKHMGYRMELGDVEAALDKVSEVAERCVFFDREADRIFCFYTGAVDEKELMRALKDKLARYMVPDELVRLEAMPHTANMKVDRAKLKAMMAEMKA
ncbi:MAG: AMP-binding protein [Clostridia bacterium]|nr:AMP-binding protein [Clostridia bacterium]